MVSDSIAYLMANLFWMYIISRFFNCFFEQNQNKCRLLSSYLFFYVVNSGLHLIFHYPLLNMVTSISGLCLIAFNYSASVFQKLLSIALIYIISMICDISVAIGFYKYYPGLKVAALDTFIAYLLIFIVEIIIERIVNLKKIEKLKASHWAALITVPLGSIVIICMIVMGQHNDKKANLFITFILLTINIMIFYLYDSIQHVYIKEIRQSALNSQIHAYAEQLDIMIQSQDRIHALHHDIKHHLLTIDALASQNRSDDIREYISNMQNYINKSGNTIYTANPVINSILNYMLRDARDLLHVLNIRVQIPDDLKTSLFDISIILGNLMDNAVRAALRSNDKKLKLHILADKGILHLSIENSYSGPILRENGKFRTTRNSEKEHGIGLLNVQNVVEKYHGTIEYHYDDTLFWVHVFMYLDIL